MSYKQHNLIILSVVHDAFLKTLLSVY